MNFEMAYICNWLKKMIRQKNVKYEDVRQQQQQQ